MFTEQTYYQSKQVMLSKQTYMYIFVAEMAAS